MKQELREEIEIPEGTTVRLDKGMFSIKGTGGELSRKFQNPRINSKIEGNKIIFRAKATQREKKLIKSFSAHLRNMMRGASQAHVYKLKICSGHFPMTASVKGKVFEVKNFVGEKVARTLNIPEGVNVKVEGEQIAIQSIDKEAAGQTAARIENLTRRAGFDRRIFQDGIYITEKDGKKIE